MACDSTESPIRFCKKKGPLTANPGKISSRNLRNSPADQAIRDFSRTTKIELHKRNEPSGGSARRAPH
jgi:hypothetical protein